VPPRVPASAGGFFGAVPTIRAVSQAELAAEFSTKLREPPAAFGVRTLRQSIERDAKADDALTRRYARVGGAVV
jgi:hypothetical protein